jgi:hypothetical protein
MLSACAAGSCIGTAKQSQATIVNWLPGCMIVAVNVTGGQPLVLTGLFCKAGTLLYNSAVHSSVHHAGAMLLSDAYGASPVELE